MKEDIFKDIILEYRGIRCVIKYSEEDSQLYGKIINVDDLILFEIEDPLCVFETFKNTVDEYFDLLEKEYGSYDEG